MAYNSSIPWTLDRIKDIAFAARVDLPESVLIDVLRKANTDGSRTDSDVVWLLSAAMPEGETVELL